MIRSRNRAPGDSDEALVPREVKTAGAVAGIVVALLGAFVGIYQVVISIKQIEVNIQKEQRLGEEAKAKEAEENRKKAEIENQRSASEAAATEKVKNAELQKEVVARDALRLSISKEIQTRTLEESFKVKQEARTQKTNEDLNFEGTLFGLFKDDRTLPSLARLSKYSLAGDERLPSILTSLVAKLDEVKEPSEVNIIFQLFEGAGPSALGSVIDSNRNALERYKSNSKKLALHQFNLDRKILLGQLGDSREPISLFTLLEKSTAALMSTQDLDTGLAALEREHIEDVWDQITISLTGNVTYRELRARGRRFHPISREAFSILEVPLGAETIEYLNHNLALQLAILRQSKRSIARLLKKTGEFVDLGGADLSGLKLLPGAYGTINFSEAFVAGADFSNAQLDPSSLETLGDAYITRERKVKPNLHSLNLRLTGKQRAAIQGGA
jgi:hypothetical protein